MKLTDSQQQQTVAYFNRANVATKPTLRPTAKEKHEIVKFFEKYALIVWAYLKTLPSEFI